MLIQPVRGRRAFREFINYAYERNAADPHWIPPLRLSEHERLKPSKNPFFAHADVELFLVRRDNGVVGRIAAIDDRLHEKTHGDQTAMFGFFEAADAEAARALLATVERWAAARGRRRVRGPINPSLNESCGLLIDGFDTDSMLLMPHNPPEYAAFIESAGYAKGMDLYAWLYEIAAQPPEVIARLAARLRERLQLVLRPLKLSEFTAEVERLRDIYCGAWEHNWGFVPPTREEFQRLATELKPIFDTRAAVVAESNGRMVACAVAVPDINQALKGTSGRLFPSALFRLLLRHRYIDQARLLLLGVAPEFRTRGLYPLLMFELHRQIAGGPYKRMEFSWVLEHNRDINQPAEQAGARRYKTYRIYEKLLG
ncbi:MAG: N-acetyltransferase [Acidobacteria bacterium]|nr:N-acetyltransferase [Acidobacteriota bacterium]